MQIENRQIIIKMKLDCTPPEGSTDTAVEIYQTVDTRVQAFLEGEDPASLQRQVFDHPGTGHLALKIVVPVESIAAAGVIENKLKNGLANFPPVIGGNPSFVYMSEIAEEEQ